MSQLTTDTRHDPRAGREVSVLCGGPAVAQGRGRCSGVHRAVLREGGGGLGPRVGARVVAAAPTLQIMDKMHGRRSFKDTNPLMPSLLVIFVWGGEAIL
jgi:hypothetical protein